MARELVVADTDLVIDFLRGSDPGASFVGERLREGRLRVTAITAFELRLGSGFFRRKGRIDLLLADRTLPLDALAAVHAGDVFVSLAGKGQGIGVKDALVAGTCRRFGFPLATRNTRHFERVPGLSLAPI